MNDRPMSVEVRPAENGSFDELLVDNPHSLHFEMMDDKTLWIGINARDGSPRWSVWVRSKSKLEVNPFEDG